MQDKYHDDDALEIERFRNMIEAIRDHENNILKPHEKAQAAEIERLEAEVVSLDMVDTAKNELLDEAADEIERLREALSKIMADRDLEEVKW